MSSVTTPKTQTGGSQTWGSGLSDSVRGPSVRRRRTKLQSDKKIADDEFMAAAIGDVEWLRQSLKDSGPEINFDKNGLTALHLAAIHGRLECLKLCIEKFKMDINLGSSTGWRAIHLCISNQTGKRSLQCLAYLLEKGADSSMANDDGITAVHQAASEGHVQCLKLLLEVGAKLEKKDCRGNTPLDLAKLWGHRKCARILAAEMWHQDKDSVAKEMQQLKKVKMQQVLRELEEEEEMKAAQQFYGDEAFKQWMAAKQLSKTPDVMPEKTSKKSKAKQADNDGLYKPNSVARVQEGTRGNAPPKIQVSVGARKLSERSRQEEFGGDYMTDEELLLGLDEGRNLAQNQEEKKDDKKAPFYNITEWNKSTKVQEKQYVANLDDNYPRDEYTMMPQVKGAPKFFQGKFIRPLTPNAIDEDVKAKGTTTKLRKPRLPQEIINKTLAGDESLQFRGQIFKCKHIGDVHTKKKYDTDQKGRPEAPLHLSNDVRSYLVQNSVKVLQHTPKSSSSKSPTSTFSKGTEWMDDHFPLPMVMQTLKNMSRPTHFPNVHGNEYLFNFGDVK